MVRVEDTLIGQVRRIPVDMVVLATGLEPQHDAKDLARTLHISCGDGFFAERHPKLAPVSTATDGIFIAGVCQGPKDIPDTVAQASAAAAKVVDLFAKPHLLSEPMIALVVLVLPDIAGMQDTDSMLLRTFVDRGGVALLFGPHIPYGDRFEREDLCGGKEKPIGKHSWFEMQERIQNRVSPGAKFVF